MNKVLLSGRLVKDPETKTANGVNGKILVTNFVLAVPRIGKSNESDFIPCVSFGRTAENISRYTKQGMKIIITDGKWRTDKYTDRGGNTIYTNNCVVSQFEFAESKSSQSSESCPDFSEELPNNMVFT